MTPRRRADQVEDIRLFAGSVVQKFVIQVSTPGTVTTHFLTRDQTYQIWEQARVALMKTGEPDPLDALLASYKLTLCPEVDPNATT